MKYTSLWLGATHWPRWERAVWAISLFGSLLWIIGSIYTSVTYVSYAPLEHYEEGPTRFTFTSGDGDDIPESRLSPREKEVKERNKYTEKRNELIRLQNRQKTSLAFILVVAFAGVIAYWSLLRTVLFFVDRFKEKKTG